MKESSGAYKTAISANKSSSPSTTILTRVLLLSASWIASIASEVMVAWGFLTLIVFSSVSWAGSFTSLRMQMLSTIAKWGERSFLTRFLETVSPTETLIGG